ncbi:aryl sulfotransferase [uncultured Campylobacter sp.]|uniref:aryl sulfotransferase n=1 Tax=uncultured Campylobacter sp. TaxID=218934 RepID=UPI00261CC8C9|nr:aryl sulfotransferase [uncultured Campylobacter sp.]
MKTELENPAQETSAQNRKNFSKNCFGARSLWLIFAAIFSAIAATFCCLPALLFLIFGASFSIFSGAEALEGYRAPLSALALFCFALSAFFFFKKPRACSLQSGRKKWILIYALLGALLAFMLTYPEILGGLYA